MKLQHKNYTLYQHQGETCQFIAPKHRAYIASTMGCGKTLCIIHDVDRFLQQNPGKKVLILAPKSLLHSVWEAEFNQFTPWIHVSVGTAPAAKREAAFAKPADVYITNIDALDWLAKKPPGFFTDYDYIAIDEATSIKNNTARTKAAQKIKKYFNIRRLLSGTPTAGPLIDLFYQYLFLDDGVSLKTNSYYKFRQVMMYAKQNGPHPNMKTWHNKPGMEQVVAQWVKDITIRYVLEEVVNMPPKVVAPYRYKPNAKVELAYKKMLHQAELQLQSGTITAINAASLTTKLLQIASGAVYDENGNVHLVDTQRYELVLDIVNNTPHAVVFYNWRSQREFMMDLASKRGIDATFIDGTVNNTKRKERVNDFQAGKYKVIFLQVKAASHGLTLTKAYTTIWSCPSYLADYYQQANARVYRIGQKHRTLTINIEAENTLDGIVYSKLNGKINDIDLLNAAIRANRI